MHETCWEVLIHAIFPRLKLTSKNGVALVVLFLFKPFQYWIPYLEPTYIAPEIDSVGSDHPADATFFQVRLLLVSVRTPLVSSTSPLCSLGLLLQGVTSKSKSPTLRGD